MFKLFYSLIIILLWGRVRKTKTREYSKCLNSVYDAGWVGLKQCSNALKPTLRHDWAYFQVQNNQAHWLKGRLFCFFIFLSLVSQLDHYSSPVSHGTPTASLPFLTTGSFLFTEARPQCEEFHKNKTAHPPLPPQNAL